MKIALIWVWLLAFLRLGVGEGEVDPDPGTDPAAGEAADEIVVEDPADDPDPAIADPAVGGNNELTAAQKAAQTERERADRYERELAEIRRGQQPAPREDDVTRQENERLADPKTTPLEKWQINANRELRRGAQTSSLALAQAQDLADKTNFATIATTNPALFNRYSTKVEEKLAEIRARGYNASRETILDAMVGKDMRDGKFKKSAKPAAAAAAPRGGKLPGARSDVNGKGALTKLQKLEKSLDGVNI